MQAVDFFCGSGGMTYGIKKAGINVIAGIDIEPNCKKTYESNNTARFLQKDIFEYTPKMLEKDIGISKNDDNLLFIACSPCQYWSKINTDKTKSHITKNLLENFSQFLLYFKPGYLVLENVPGLYNNKEESVLADFLSLLNEEGYVYDHKIVDSNKFGVPQHRKRYVLVGTRVNKSISLPEEESDDSLIVRNFIGEKNGFAPIDAGHKDETDFIHTSASLTEKNLRRIRLTPKNGGNRMVWKDNPELQIKAYVGKENFFVDVYGRMFWDKPSPTITTRFNSFSNGRFGHPEEDRALSLREGATLQTFPKSYKFYAPSNEIIARLIGNAVPPELARRIGTVILENKRNA